MCGAVDFRLFFSGCWLFGAEASGSESRSLCVCVYILIYILLRLRCFFSQLFFWGGGGGFGIHTEIISYCANGSVFAM